MKILSQLFDFLNTNCNYAVLRNYEGLPELNTSRDIDIIIEKQEYKRIKHSLITVIIDNGWQIVNYLNSDRLVTYVCGRADEKGTELIQLDFFFNTSVKGVLLIAAKELLAHKRFNGKVYHLSSEYEFLDKYLYNKAVGKPYPEKYIAVKQAECKNKVVTEKIKLLFSVQTIELADVGSGKSLFWAAVKYNLKKRPLGLLVNFTQFIYTYIANYMCSNTGFSIGFTGPDGAGKTTVLESIHREISPIFESATIIYHFRPTLFGNLGDTAKSIGIKQEVDKNFSNPHRGTKTGVLNSLFRLLYYSFDYIIGYFVKVKTVCRITRIVIFDRYYTDIIVDSRRSRIHLSTRLLYYWGKLFIPRLHYNILLTADTDIIFARKQELDRKGIETINAKLDYLKTKKGYYLILNNGKPKEAVREILIIVFEEQHSKNLKRLNYENKNIKR